MKCVALLIVLTTIVQLTHGHPHEPDPVRGEVGGHEYLEGDTVFLVSYKKRDIIEADFFCTRWGGKLVSVHDQARFDYLKTILGIDIHAKPKYFVGVMADSVQAALAQFKANPNNYVDCNATDCHESQDGPFYPDNDELEASCIYHDNCTFTNWVDADGMVQTFLPFNSTIHYQCVTMNVEDCENIDGCTRGVFDDKDCIYKPYRRFVCEKPVSSCPSEMFNPPFDPVDDYDWIEFLGLQAFCGPKFIRIVVNECAKRFLDLQELKLVDYYNSTNYCPAVTSNLLQTELWNGTCGIFEGPGCSRRKRAARGGGGCYYFFGVKASAYFGSGRMSSPSDVIRRDSPFCLKLSCLYDSTGHARIKSSEFTMTKNIVPLSFAAPGQIEVKMSIFADCQFDTPLNTTAGNIANVISGSKLNVEITSSCIGPVLKVARCFITTSPDPGTVIAGNLYSIASNCTFADNSSVIEDGTSYRVRFHYDAFLFNQDPTALQYIHCTVALCLAEGSCGTDFCMPSQVKRSTDWSHESLSVGPVKVWARDQVSRFKIQDALDQEEERQRQEQKAAFVEKFGLAQHAPEHDERQDQKAAFVENQGLEKVAPEHDERQEPKDVRKKHKEGYFCEKKQCSHECHEISGKAFCSCPDGLDVQNDGKTCAMRDYDSESQAWIDQHQPKQETLKPKSHKKKENNKKSNKRQYKPIPQKKGKDKTLLYVAATTFVASSLLCAATFVNSRRKTVTL